MSATSMSQEMTAACLRLYISKIDGKQNATSKGLIKMSLYIKNINLKYFFKIYSQRKLQDICKKKYKFQVNFLSLAHICLHKYLNMK